MFEEIEQIIKNKWEDLEKQEVSEKDKRDEDAKKHFKSLIIKLSAYKDFKVEYKKIKRDLKQEHFLFTKEEQDTIMFNFFQKWAFIFTAILNLDISNIFILSYANESLSELMEEE